MVWGMIHQVVVEVAPPAPPSSTEVHSWGHSSVVLGTIVPFVEPFREHLSPNIDNVSEKLTLRYPHEGPWVEPRLHLSKASDSLVLGDLYSKHARNALQGYLDHKKPRPLGPFSGKMPRALRWS